jgi:hypothetical protein
MAAWSAVGATPIGTNFVAFILAAVVMGVVILIVEAKNKAP